MQGPTSITEDLGAELTAVEVHLLGTKGDAPFEYDPEEDLRRLEEFVAVLDGAE